jgi:4-amino-4-deoxy-L-arabinose transferase-like glycosyltransferase
MKKYILILIITLASTLRLYNLSKVPPSLYWDEVSLGYNAYSILKTAHDEHGKFLPITNFGAFGDYKPPGYIYATVPSIAIFGPTEFAVRFPSAMFGILTVAITYFLAKKLFDNEIIANLTALFLAISPWHVQFSRAAFEANFGLFLSTFGIYMFIKFAKDKAIFIFPSAILFIAAMYTFTGQRLFVPFILIILTIQFYKEIIANKKTVVLATILGVILLWPLFKFTSTIEGKLRFDEVTIFKDLNPINESIKYRQQDNFAKYADIIHNRRFLFAYYYLKHYFDAFDPSFLFFHGDVNPRLSSQGTGELYLFDFVLVISGIYFLINKKQKYSFLILGWLIVSPLGPATARETPHALRMVHMLPTYQLLSAFGLYNIVFSIKRRKTAIIAGAVILSVSFFYYLHFYYLHYPKQYSSQWQYGYKEAVNYFKPIYKNYDKVLVSDNLGRAYIYLLFYLKINPDEYLKTASIVRDNFYFYNVNGFGKFIITSDYSKYNQPNTLIVASPGNLISNAIKLKTISDLQDKPVFDIGFIPK